MQTMIPLIDMNNSLDFTGFSMLGRGLVEKDLDWIQVHPAVCPAGLILAWFHRYSGLALAEFCAKNDPSSSAF